MDEIMNPKTKEQLLSLDENGEKFLAELLDKFLEKVAVEVPAAKEAAAAGDAHNVGQRIHSMKGAAMSLGLDSLAQTLKDFEAEAKGGELNNATDYFSRLEPMFQKVKELRATIKA